MLTQWASDQRLVALFVATGMMRNTMPQSVLIIGQPDEGKSSLLSTFKQTPTVAVVSNTYGNELRALLHDHDEVRHLLVDEIAALFSHSDTAVSNIMVFLRQVMSGDAGEEAVGQGQGRRQFDFRGRVVGLLSSVTSSDYSRLEPLLAANGMRSRFNEFVLRRDEAERQRVRMNVMRRDVSDLLPWRWTPWQTSRPAVALGASETRLLSRYVEEFFPSLKNRDLVRMQSLLQAVAFLHGREVVTPLDVVLFSRLHEYWTHYTAQRVTSPRIILGAGPEPFAEFWNRVAGESRWRTLKDLLRTGEGR